MTNLNLYINHSTNDLPFGSTTFILDDPAYDFLLFSQGSAPSGGVSDGDALPSEALLNRYAVQLDAVNPVNVPKYFLADSSSGILRDIWLAGNQNKRYVFDAHFDGVTASEPQLEAWDDIGMSSALIPALGAGSPSLSWYRAVSTKNGLPGANWVGSTLAGATNVLLLNAGAGALTIATHLYFNFKIVIPGGYVTPGLHTPILVITYATT